MDATPPLAGEAVALSLGGVCALAEVEVNGIACGTAWAHPWMIEIGHALRAGRNSLRVRVTVGWHNRLVAAQVQPSQLDGCGSAPWTAIPIETDGALEATGLFGPVTIQRFHSIGT